MSWLSDSDANRFKKSYIQGFLDVSGGNLIVESSSTIQVMSSAYSGQAALVIKPDRFSVFTGQSSYDISYETFAALGFLGVSYQYTTADIYNRIKFIGSSTLTGNETFIGSDSSYTDLVVYGNVETTSGGNIIGAKNLLITRDASINQKLYVAGDVSMNSNLSVNVDLSVNQNFFVTGRSLFSNDVSMNRNVDIGSGNNSLAINKDISANIALDVSGTTVLRGPLSITRDLSLNQSLQIGSDLSVNRFLYVGNNTLFNTDVSVNQNLYVTGRALFGRPPPNGTAFELDLSGQMRIYETVGTAATATTGSLVIKHADASGVSSIVFPSANDAGNDYAYIQYQENVGGPSQKGLLTIGVENESGSGTAADRLSLYAAGGSGFVGVNTKDPIFHLDISGTANVSSTLITNAIDPSNVASQMTIAQSQTTGNLDIGTNASRSGAINIGTANYSKTITVGGSSTGTTSLRGGTIIISPASTLELGNNDPDVAISIGRDQTNGTLDIGNFATRTAAINIGTGSSAKTMSIGGAATTLQMYGVDASFAGNLKLGSGNKLVAINKDVSLNISLDVSGATMLRGITSTLSDVSINGRLLVSSDVSLNQKLFVNSDVSFNSNLTVGQGLTVNSRALFNADVSLNNNTRLGRGINSVAINKDISTNFALDVSGITNLRAPLYTLSDVSINGKLSVGGDISLNGNISIGAIQTIGKGLKQPPSPMTANVANIPGHGSYYVYTSSLSDSTSPYFMFDSNDTTSYNSASGYTNVSDPSLNVWAFSDTISDVLSIAYPGYRLHIDLPYQINLTSFSYRTSTGRYPAQGTMLGSNNGTSWYNIYSFDLSGTYNNSTNQSGPITFENNLASNTSLYSKYALVIKSIACGSFPGNRFTFREMQLYGNNNILSTQGIGATSIGVSDNLTVGATSNLYGNVTIGSIDNVYNRTGTARLLIMEPSGTVASATSGSLVLQHGDASGVSSIVFRSTNDVGSDYAYIQYKENVGSGTTQKGLFTIGVENEAGSGTSADRMSLYAAGGSGLIGLNTLDPQYHLDLSGNARVTGTMTASLDVSLNRNVKLGSGTNSVAINKDISTNFALDVSGITNLRAPLYTLADVSVNGKLFATGDASFNSSLSVGQDLSVNRFLYVNNATLFNGDISTNQNLYVAGKATFGRPPPATGLYELDVSGQMRIYEQTGSNVISSTSVATLTLEHADASGASSIMFKSPSTTLNGDYAYIKYQDLSGTTTSNAGLLTIGVENDPTAPTTKDMISLYAAGGSGYVGVNTQNPSFNLDVSGGFRTSGDASINVFDFYKSGNPTLKINNVEMITLASSDVRFGNATTSGNMSLAGNQNTGSLYIGGVQTTGNLYIGSLNTSRTGVIVIGGATNKNTIGNVSITGSTIDSSNNLLQFVPDASFGKNMFVSGDVSVNTNLYVGQDVSINRNLYVASRTVLNNDVSINTNLDVTGNAKVSSSLITNTINPSSAASTLNIATTQTSGSINIATESTRTGAISIGNRALETNIIRLGNFDISNNSIRGHAGLSTAVFSSYNLTGNLRIGESMTSGVHQYSFNTNSGSVQIAGRARESGTIEIGCGNNNALHTMSIGTGESNAGKLNIANGALSTGSINILDGSGSTGTATIGRNSAIRIVNSATTTVDVSATGLLTLRGSSLNVFGATLFNSDVSMNQNVELGAGNNSVAINKDISSNFALDVSGVTNFLGPLYTLGDVSVNGRLFASGDASFNQKLSIGQDVSINRNLDISGTLRTRKIEPFDPTLTGGIVIGSTLVGPSGSVKIGTTSTNTYVDIGNTTINGGTFRFNENGLITGSTISLNMSFADNIQTGNVSVGPSLTTGNIIIGSQSGTAHAGTISIGNAGGRTGQIIIGGHNSSSTTYVSGGSVRIKDQGSGTFYVGRLPFDPIADSISVFLASGPYTSGQFRIMDGSGSTGNITIGRNSAIKITNSATTTVDVSATGLLTLRGSSLNVFGATTFNSDVSMNQNVELGAGNNSIAINKDISSNFALDVSGATNFRGIISTLSDISVNGRLFTSGDVSLNQKLFVSNDISTNSNVHVGNTVFTKKIDTVDNAANIDIGATQSSGRINIGGSSGRTGNINIGTNTNTGSPFTIQLGHPSGVGPNIGIGLWSYNGSNGILQYGGAGQFGATGNMNIFSGATSTLHLGSTMTGGIINLGRNDTTGSTTEVNIATGSASTGNVNLGRGPAIKVANGTSTNIDISASGTLALRGTTVTAPTTSLDNSSNEVATTAFVKNNINNLVAGALPALDTLNELANALNNEANFGSKIIAMIGLRSYDTSVVHITDAESIAGTKTFTDDTIMGGNLTINQNLTTVKKGAFGYGTAPVGTPYEFDISGQMRIYEEVGSNVTGNTSVATLTLEHGDSSGCSSIMFKSPSTASNGDYAYIKYQDLSGTTSNNGLLTIGVENDPTASTTADKISLYAAGGLGYVGINTLNPTFALDVTGGARVSGTVTVNTIAGSSTGSSISLYGTTTGNIALGGAISSANTITIAGSASTGNVRVNGANIRVGNGISNVAINKDVSAGFFFDVSGDSSFRNRLFVDSDASFGRNIMILGDVSINTKLFVSKDVSINTNFYVGQDVSINRNLYVANRTVLSSDVSMNQNLDIGSGSNSVAINKDISSNFALDISGITNLRAPLYAMSDVSLSQKLFVTQDASFNSSLAVGQDVSVNRSLFVTSRSLFSSDVSFNRNVDIGSGNNSVAINKDISSNFALDISGITSLRSPLYAMSDVSLSQKLFVTQDASFNQNLSVGQDISVNRSLFVTNRSLFSSDVSFNRNVDIGSGTNSVAINKDISSNFALDISGETNVRGNLSLVGGTITVNGLPVSGGGDGTSITTQGVKVGTDANYFVTIDKSNFYNDPSLVIYYNFDTSLNGYVLNMAATGSTYDGSFNVSGLSTTTGMIDTTTKKFGAASLKNNPVSPISNVGVIVPNASLIPISTTMTFSMWVNKLGTPAATTLDRIFEYSNNTSGTGSENNSIALEINSSGVIVPVLTSGPNSCFGTLTSPILSYNICDGSWNHIVWTITPSTSFIYINGSIKHYDSITTAVPTSARVRAYIAFSQINAGTRDFSGNIDEFRYYSSKALNQAEIYQLSNNTFFNLDICGGFLANGSSVIYEPLGSKATANTGTLTLLHGDASGSSSIMFKSVNDPLEYGYIQYEENSAGSTGFHYGLMTIGIENDAGAYATQPDRLSLFPSGGRGFVGVNTKMPSCSLDVSGQVRILEGQGTLAAPTAGSLILEHTAVGGTSSIMFKGPNTSTSDYAYVQYTDASSVIQSLLKYDLSLGTAGAAVGNTTFVSTGTNTAGLTATPTDNSFAWVTGSSINGVTPPVCISFNQTNVILSNTTSRINYLQASLPSSMSSFTFSAWIKPGQIAAPDSSQIAWMIANLTNASNNGSVDIYLDSTNGFIYATLGDDISNNIRTSSALSADNTWYHLVYTFDANLRDGFLYLNGAAGKVLTGYGHSDKALKRNSSLLIGLKWGWNSGTGGNDVYGTTNKFKGFRGQMAFVNVFDRGISASDVLYLYNNPAYNITSNPERGLLTIGVENDTGAINNDRIVLWPGAGTGNVGINTRTPGTTLDVNGTLNVSSTITSNNGTVIISGKSGAVLRLANQTGLYNAGETLLDFYGGESWRRLGGIGCNDRNDGYNGTYRSSTSFYTTWDTSYNLEAMRITGKNKTVADCATVQVFGDISCGKIGINETVGTAPSVTSGSLTLRHNDAGGTSSIVFPSVNNSGSDYAYIQYQENLQTTNFTGTNENGLLTIGIENDGTTVGGADRISLFASGGNGFVGINTKNPLYTLDVNGNVNATSYNASSDYRIKTSVMPLDLTFTVDVLNPVKYVLKDDKDEKLQVGFIAHEVQEFYPFLVNGVKDGPNTQSINYNGFIGILTKEIKDLKAKVLEQEERIAEQDARLQALEKLLLNK